MKREYDEITINKLVDQYKINDYFSDHEIPKYIIRYKKGEYLSSSKEQNHNILFLIQGSISIYGVREDGSAYSLAMGTDMYLIGDLELFETENNCVYAEALTDVTCIAISVEEYKDRLLDDSVFVRKVAENMAKKLALITKFNVRSTTLNSRVINFLKYRSPDHTFIGIEKTAFCLHCSPRQLQRVLNDMEQHEIVQRLGKGKYQLKLN